jgi:hypothetical protein
MICKNCKKEIPATNKFCSLCGVSTGLSISHNEIKIELNRLEHYRPKSDNCNLSILACHLQYVSTLSWILGLCEYSPTKQLEIMEERLKGGERGV